MAKCTLILLQIAFTLSALFASSITIGGNKFHHIGLFKSVSRGVQNVDWSNYFVSFNAAGWTTAENDCKAFFGVHASLIAIDSVEEWDFLKIKLESYGALFWTGGIYFPQSDAWVWSVNNHPLPPFAPWDVGQPSPHPNALHRVSLAHWNRDAAFWRTEMLNELHPYICEIQQYTVPVNCYDTNDLIIVLDSSGSISSSDYAIALSFVERLASAFTVHEPNRISFIIFSNAAQAVISITNSYTRASISSAILNAPYMNCGTATWLGIDLAVAQFKSSPRNVPLNMVLLTDGKSDDKNLTIAAAQSATAEGIRSFTVGITDDTNPEELHVIAGGVINRIFTTDNFDELINLLAPLSLRVCANN